MLSDAELLHLEVLVTRHLVGDSEARVDDMIELVRSDFPFVEVAALGDAVGRLVDRARGLGAIGTFFDDQAVTEVMVNGPGPVWIDRTGHPEPTDVILGIDDISVLIERILDPLGLRVDRLSPLADARLADGSRVNIIVPPLALDGPVVTVRRFRARHVGLDEFGPPAVRDLLTQLVHGHVTMVVVGGTGAGKTTLLNSLAGHIVPNTRIVTIEDTAELRLPGRHVVRLEARPPSREGVGEITIRELVRNALRMRPDRLIIGETRGAEAFDLLLALNTGHAGSLTTCHANDPLSGLRRLETLALLGAVGLPFQALREQLLAAIDVVIHVGWDGPRRRILSVAEVDPRELATREIWPSPAGDPIRSSVREVLGAP